MSSHAQIPPMEEAYNFFNATLNPDGSLTRRSELPVLPASPELEPDDPAPALSRDIPLNAAAGTFLRLFRPRNTLPNAKLPLVIYFHGGGFILYSATTAAFHDSCSHVAARTPALVASVAYRRAPEHRLPAAYEDAMDAVTWAKAQALSGGAADPWVEELADFSRVFLMGFSAGGNIAYRAAVNAAESDLRPMKIVGLILQQPFFGGVRRTGSELRYYNDPITPLHGLDLMWALALPEGAGRAHEYCDPMAAGGAEIGRLPATLVRGCSRDPLVDKQKEFAGVLAARGVRVVEKFVDGGYHGVDVLDPEYAEGLYNDVRDFIGSV